MKFYDLDEYIIIIKYTDYTESRRCIKKEKLESFINKLNEEETVWDYLILRKVDYEY